MNLPLLPRTPAGPDADRRGVLARRIRLLVAATIGYNVVEAVLAIGAGTAADSTALIGFGLDSIIEVSSAAAVAWQFAGRDPEAREKTALRIIAFSFFALAAYVTAESVRALLGGAEAEHSDGFLAHVERAMKKGWKIELISWRQQTNGGYRNKKFRAKWGDQFKIIELDDYLEALIDTP